MNLLREHLSMQPTFCGRLILYVYRHAHAYSHTHKMQAQIVTHAHVSHIMWSVYSYAWCRVYPSLFYGALTGFRGGSVTHSQALVLENGPLTS